MKLSFMFKYAVLYCDCAVRLVECVWHQNLLVSVGKKWFCRRKHGWKMSRSHRSSRR